MVHSVTNCFKYNLSKFGGLHKNCKLPSRAPFIPIYAALDIILSCNKDVIVIPVFQLFLDFEYIAYLANMKTK